MADGVLTVHVVAGAAGLALGPVVVYAAARGHVLERIGESYHLAVLAVCLSATALAAVDLSRLWFFVPIAVGSYALAFAGWRAARRGGRGWAVRHLRGYGGSYIALVTALLVVTTDSPAAWVVPTLAGAPVLEWMGHRLLPGVSGEERAARLPA